VATYRHNLPATQVSTANLCSIKPQELRCGGDVWLLSPPCQPYTRQGLQLAEGDRRASALEHLLSQLELDSTLLPGALLLENVVGFESSAARARLHAVLTRAGYCVREVWCSPAMLGVPNQRTRYFLLARRGAASLPAALSPELQHVSLLDPSELDAACAPGGTPLAPPRGQVDAALRDACAPLSTYLEPRGAAGLDELALPQHVLERYGAAMDLVARHSRRSLCLTKNYVRRRRRRRRRHRRRCRRASRAAPESPARRARMHTARTPCRCAVRAARCPARAGALHQRHGLDPVRRPR
jgi:tRNA (cytosine38-C5)-methyltransferase